MARLLLIAAIFVSTSSIVIAQEKAAPAADKKLRVACVGASITFGAGVEQREKNCYPAQMQKLLGDGYEVRNFGVNSPRMKQQKEYPHWADPEFAEAQKFLPDVVVIDLGAIDSMKQGWKFDQQFAADAKVLIGLFRALESHPRVLVCLPMPAFKTMPGIINETIRKELTPQLQKLAYDTDTETIDLHTAFLDKSKWFEDSIHPNAEGAAHLAKVVGEVIAVPGANDYRFEKSLADGGIKAQASSFFGYRKLDFKLASGVAATVVCPHRTAKNKAYAWRGEFFGHEPQADLALLERGFHVVYVAANDMYGAPPAMKIWEEFHTLLNKNGLTGKITLIGMSRGGLYCYHWAALHPETVSVLYGDAPVCDFKSWPYKNRANRSKNEWAGLLKVHGFKDEAEAMAYKENPVDNLAPLAKAKIPIIHVVGQADSVVPVAENTDLIETRYKALGGTIEVIRKEGVEHHPHSLANPEAIVDFVMKYQGK